MNAAQIKQLLPRASRDTITLNEDKPHGLPSSPEPKRPVLDGAVGEVKREKVDSGRIQVSIVAYRVRLCDPDNLIGKYFVDCLRMAHIIRDDTEEDITYSITQKKVAKKNQEKTLVEVIT